MMLMRMRVSLALAALAALAPGVRADYVSQTYTLDHSNVLPTGTAFGTVKVEAYDGTGAAGGGLSAGQVRFTVTPNVVPAYDSIGNHFGISAFGFNTDLTLKPGQISAPKHWKLHNHVSLGGFGDFGWEAISQGQHNQNPLVLTISGLGSNASLSHFLFGSTTGPDNAPTHGALFAATVSGFNIDNRCHDTRSQVIAVLPPVSSDAPPPNGPPGPGGQGSPPPASPEPSTWLLGAMGVGGIGMCRWLRRRGA
jgi:hypothetical protein